MKQQPLCSVAFVKQQLSTLVPLLAWMPGMWGLVDVFSWWTFLAGGRWWTLLVCGEGVHRHGI